MPNRLIRPENSLICLGPAGMRHGALLGAGVARGWPRGAADAGAIRQGVCQASQERCGRCRKRFARRWAGRACGLWRSRRPNNKRHVAAPWPGKAGAPARTPGLCACSHGRRPENGLAGGARGFEPLVPREKRMACFDHSYRPEAPLLPRTPSCARRST